MATRQRKKSFLSRLILPAFSLVFLGYFGFHAFHGAYGLIGYWSILERKAERETALAMLREERQQLEHRAVLLASGSPDRETIDELARAKLNVINPDEVVYLYTSK